MSDMNDCSYVKSTVTDNDVNDDYINPITGFGGFDLSDDKQRDKMTVFLYQSLLIYFHSPKIYRYWLKS
jgi:hypothetical protein